jgi:hypothetical protein
MGETDVSSRFGSRLATEEVPRRPCLKSHRGERGVSHHPLILGGAPRSPSAAALAPRQGNTRDREVAGDFVLPQIRIHPRY